MSQEVVYKGVLVQPVERSGNKILIETTNASAAQKAGIPFLEMRGTKAVFGQWVEEAQLVPL